MKIAVLISGEYRNFGICRKTMKFLDDPNVDIYFSTWAETKYSLPIAKIDETIPVTKEQVLRDLGKVAIIDVDNKKVVPRKYNEQMIYRWRRGVEIIRDSGIKYDYLVITRPDIFFNDAFRCDLSRIERYKDNVGFTWAGDLSAKKLADTLFLGTYDAISNIILNLDIEEWVNAREGDWHKWWYDHVNKFSPTILNASELNHYIFARYWCTSEDTFSDVLRKHNTWRDILVIQQSKFMTREALVDCWNESIISGIEENLKSGKYSHIIHDN